MAVGAAQQQGGLPPELMDRLSAMQMVAGGARASRGAGEKPSRVSGPGMEFAEYRAYRAGDDLRHVDPRSLAQGAPLTRNYVQRRQLMVSIVLDLTPSMLSESGEKAGRAVGLAKALGFAVLAGQDRVEVLLLGESGDIARSPVWQGRSRAVELFDFVKMPKLRAGRDHVARGLELDSLMRASGALMPRLDGGCVVVVISDFWEGQAAQALAQLAATPARLVALQVLSAAERDPTALGEGVHRLIDAETGEERDFAISAELVRQYQTAMAAHRAALMAATTEHNVFLTLPVEQSLGTMCLETLPAAGVLV